MWCCGGGCGGEVCGEDGAGLAGARRGAEDARGDGTGHSVGVGAKLGREGVAKGLRRNGWVGVLQRHGLLQDPTYMFFILFKFGKCLLIHLLHLTHNQRLFHNRKDTLRSTDRLQACGGHLGLVNHR